MGNLNALLSSRLKVEEPSVKMARLAERSASGSLSTFQGVFKPSELTSFEKEQLEEILEEFKGERKDTETDLKELLAITSEVKAINHQSALLHGERIERAQKLLTKYEEGAFSSWLILTYGNRQTPYNLLQYYTFYKKIPEPFKPKLESMPRQAVYTLASRDGDFSLKLDFIKAFQNETKLELLKKIRELFPLDEEDKRKVSLSSKAEKLLLEVDKIFNAPQFRPGEKQKTGLKELLKHLLSILN